MKKIVFLSVSFILILSLLACKSAPTVNIPDLTGMEYGDVLKWSFENDINLVVSSEYNDDVLPNTVFFQDIEAGKKVAVNSDLTIIYSRGYSLDGIVVIPDFINSTKKKF